MSHHGDRDSQPIIRKERSQRPYDALRRRPVRHVHPDDPRGRLSFDASSSIGPAGSSPSHASAFIASRSWLLASNSQGEPDEAGNEPAEHE